MTPTTGAAADGWAVLQRVLLPGEGPAGTTELYVRGSGLEWTRTSVTVPAGGTASFATYFGAFPAGIWRANTRVDRVRLDADIDGTATVVVRGTDEHGTVRTIDESSRSGRVSLELPLEPDAGWLWFEVGAVDGGATVRDAAWSARGPRAADASAAVCITTFDREVDCVRLLDRLASDSAVTRLLGRVIVVDQGTRPLRETAGFDETAERLGGRLVLVEQPNLGGSGGFSRGMLDAADGPEDFALLLDDDVDLEPESVARMLAFAAFSPRPTIVGAHMLSLPEPTLVHSWGERVARRTFWWGPVDDTLAPVDVADAHLETTPTLSAPHPVDFNGWWMCLIPTATVRRIGAALPFFIKWDDAEYGLRAAAAGVPTVTLPGAALWHVPWTGKDNGLDWQAYFHIRNRLVAALIHSTSPGGMLAASFAQDVNHLLCMQYGSVRARHLALRDVLSGPRHLPATIGTRRRDVQGILAASGQLPVSDQDMPPTGHPVVRAQRPSVIPALIGAALHQLRKSPPGDGPVQAALDANEGRWWRLGALDSAALRSAGGSGWFVLRRNRRLMLALASTTLLVHLRLLLGWPRLARAYRAAAPVLAGPVSWRRLFGSPSNGD